MLRNSHIVMKKPNPKWHRQTFLSFLSWCKILRGALCIWTRQNQPDFEQVKYWIFSHQANMLHMLLIIVATENITHILWTCIQVLIILSIQSLCWVALLHWLFDISEDKWTELEHCQGKPTKQNKFLQGFPPCCFERDGLHSLCHFVLWST